MKLSGTTPNPAGHAAKRFIIFALIPCAIKITAEFISEEESYSEMTSRCLLDIVRKYLYESKKIALRYDRTPSHLAVVDRLFQSLNIPIMSNADEVPMGKELDTRIPSDATIILSERTNITRYLACNLFTSRTVFLTVLWNSSDAVRGVFEEFWKYNVVNTFALVVAEDEIDLYYYEPFAKCNESEPAMLDIWSENKFRYGKTDRIGNRYAVSSLNGCRFNVSVMDVPPTIIFPNPDEIHGTHDIDGIEGILFKTISQKLNGSFLYKVPDDAGIWGFPYPRPTGAIGEVYNKKSIFSGGGPSAIVERVPFMDFVLGTTGGSECVYWEIPSGAAKAPPDWLLIFFKEFSALTWIFFTATLFVVLFTYHTIALITKPPQMLSVFDTFLFLFSSSLGITSRRSGNLQLNILFGAWIWYALIIMTAYESLMRSKLTVPLRHKDIQTYQELLESNLELYGVQTTIRLVYDENENPIEKMIGQKVKPWNSTVEEMIRKITTERNVGYLREYVTFSYLAFRNSTNYGKIHTMNLCAYFYYPTMYIQKYFPVTHVIENLVSRLRDSGLLLHWKKLFVPASPRSEMTTIKISLEHITAAFIAFGTGLAMATVAFIVELFLYFKEKSRQSLTRSNSKIWVRNSCNDSLINLALTASAKNRKSSEVYQLA